MAEETFRERSLPRPSQPKNDDFDLLVDENFLKVLRVCLYLGASLMVINGAVAEVDLHCGGQSGETGVTEGKAAGVEMARTLTVEH